MAHLSEEIGIVGWSCRLPGAQSIAELWSLLIEGRCTVSRIPEDRFSLQHFGHPRRGERGRSYTWSAGILDDIWGFDPSFFGISPREAQQMDPQQRILLQLTWEALEDAGIRPSTIAGSEVGVFIGGTVSEYAQPVFGDPCVAEPHFATGNAMAVLANRISYIFDLQGPSITFDTACSSSLVALHEAVGALRSGRINTAIVGGINIMAAPTGFISFSQASMLSPTGLCRAFSADADGYVRAEGGVVLVLRNATAAASDKNRVHGFIKASDVNSDGRTNGISLPSAEGQERLIRRVYDRSGISAERLAFVEAHGTGTPAGDPIEALALGRALGRTRSNPLPIGSLKTNIGHLEAASGLAGLIKATLALQNGVLPASLHFSAPNPNIDFYKLNLEVCDRALKFNRSYQAVAGVSTFGFGGTNAHVIVAAGPEQVGAARLSLKSNGYLSISAKTKPALVALATKYLDRVSTLSDNETELMAAAAAHRRERMPERLVITSTRQRNVSEALKAFVNGDIHKHLTAGQAPMSDLPVAFVYSGNGSQWPGMGRSAYLKNEDFRRRFDEIDSIFRQFSGWSLRDAIFDVNLSGRLALTSVAQPLIFAIQSATTNALRSRGLNPAVILGHSVGEVAAVEAAGILDLRSAVHLIYYRSKNQEVVRKAGRMMAVLSGEEIVQPLVDQIGRIEIAAYNAPRALTVSGSDFDISRFSKLAKQKGIACVDLDLDYPFHSKMMAPVQSSLIADIDGLKPNKGIVPFVSAVEGDFILGTDLDATYWWRNIRDPVRFMDAVRAATSVGARLFIEIGPRELLTRHIRDAATAETGPIKTFSALTKIDSNDFNPIDKAVANAVVLGAKVNIAEVAGTDPGCAIPLPMYPWQQEPFRYSSSQEAIGWFQKERHPLAGDRYSADTLEWHSQVDTALFPELLDHRLGERVVLPGTAFLEMALFAASQWLETDSVTLADFELLTALELDPGQSYEVLTRISHVSRTFEILCRPRLSQASWTLHARGGIRHGTGMSVVVRPAVTPGATPTKGESLYQIADRSGLHYGPAFSFVKNATLHKNDVIEVELTPTTKPTDYLLDFMRLDCCAQGLILLFPPLQACERGVAYIPVRVDEVNLYRPHSVPSRALIEIVDKNERSILANLTILSNDDAVIVTLRAVRCHATSFRRPQALGAVALVETIEMAAGPAGGATGVPFSIENILDRAKTAGLTSVAPDILSECSRLLEAWAMLAAYEIISALAHDNRFAFSQIAGPDRIPVELRPLFESLLIKLSAADLVREHEGSWSLLGDASLPNSAAYIAELAGEFPERAAELLIAAEISRNAKQLATQASANCDLTLRSSKSAFDFYNSANGSTAHLVAALRRLLQETFDVWPKIRALRVLQIGASPLFEGLFEQAGCHVVLTVLEPDSRMFEREKLSYLAGTSRLIDRLDGGPYDLIVSADTLHRLPPSVEPADLRNALAPDGAFIGIVREVSLFRELVFGLRPADEAEATNALYAARSAEDWATAFETVSLTYPNCGGDTATLIVGKLDAATTDNDRLQKLPSVEILTGYGPESSILANAFAARLQSRGYRCHPTIADFREAPDAQTPIIIHFVSCDENAGNAEALAQACLDIKAAAERFDSKPAVFWLIFNGALAEGSSRVEPVQTAAWAFTRTLANEFPNLSVRKIDIKHGISADIAAEQVCKIIESNTPETEYHVDETTVRVMRVAALGHLPKLDQDIATAARLERRQSVGQRVAWHPMIRRAPEADEVEIAVGATGLNFRDVMYSLGILPDDLFDNGVCGPTLGLECAGTVVACGAAVQGLKAGDRVMALAPNSFSTHVTVSESLTAKIPDRLSIEAAATIPVAFITAYYSLVTLARLARAEWVLIHGGAGAVGMAAIQIAKARGAKIIATAGTEAKRELLRTLGITHILDSRSTRFADDVRKITGAGVDVVLNSLAGEAMERSIDCLCPFGRFIELGKRDFAAATYIGLRPFRKNLSYFGVDIDQLAASHRSILRDVFDRVIKGFAVGSFTPLPHSIFETSALNEAFRLLQQSIHIGKIVIRAPDRSTIRRQAPVFTVDPERTHLITGGFSGLGLAAAEWLADRGARYLALVGRRGAATSGAHEVLSRLSQKGIHVFAEACDVSDPEQVDILFERIGQTMPPIVGVIHSAMVLDDAIISNLNVERFERVLAPKVTGADNLDRATRSLKLDYFVLFSSVVTLIGNRGQGSYVAANAYLEGLARRRRQAGLPALAIGWGPIVDVGVVARTERMRTDIHKMGGLRGMKASEALDLMALAICESGDDTRMAAMTIAPHDGAFSVDLLPGLKSPTYQHLISQSRESTKNEKIDLRTLIATEDMETVREKVIQTITSQVARVLLFRKEDINCTRSLSEMGLDSLMAVELAMVLEECFDLHLSLKGSAGMLTVTGLADEIMLLANSKDRPTNDRTMDNLIRQHVKEVDPEHRIEHISEMLNG